MVSNKSGDSEMEIVHVVRQYKPSVGGLEDSVSSLCMGLSKVKNINVRIVTLDRLFSDRSNVLPKHEVIDGIPVTRISFVGSSRYPIAFGVLKELKGADIVHVHAIDFFFDFLALTKFLHRKQLVASTHGGFFHTRFAARLKRVYFQTITRVSGLFYGAICATSGNDASTFTQIAPKKVVTIENGVNVSKWGRCASPAPVKTMIYIGRWSENKAIPVLIQLLASLRKRDENWRLIVAGLPGDETLESLSACAEKNGVKDFVQLCESPSVEEIGSLIRNASYIASASDYEGFGISIVEGLSAGLLPILSPIPPFIKLLDALSFGCTINQDNLDSTAEQIEVLHSRLEQSPAQFKNQCIKVAARYDSKGMVNRFLDVYESIGARKSAWSFRT